MSRPILPWHSPLILTPPDDTQVYIRRLYTFDKPALANWTQATASFNVQVPEDGSEDSNIVAIPQWIVHSWRYRFLADVPPST
jgi:hypothetical protein